MAYIIAEASEGGELPATERMYRRMVQSNTEPAAILKPLGGFFVPSCRVCWRLASSANPGVRLDLAAYEMRPLFFSASLWTPWQGIRKVKDGPGDFELYGFMTAAPNALIKAIHEKAMPVIRRTQEETETWPTAPWSQEAITARSPR